MKRYVKQFPNLNLHGRFLIFDKKKRGVQEKRGGEGEYCNSKGKNEGEGSGVSEQGVQGDTTTVVPVVVIGYDKRMNEKRKRMKEKKNEKPLENAFSWWRAMIIEKGEGK